MSYILDALKKSQQQRDLGNIPTLTDTAPVNAAGHLRKNLPVMGALTLAILAVLLALYAVLSDRLTEPRDPLKIAEHAAPGIDAKLPEAPVSAIGAENPALVDLPTSGESGEVAEKSLQARSVSSPVNRPEKTTTASTAESEKLMPAEAETEADRASAGAGKAEVSSRQPQPGERDSSNQQTLSIPSVSSVPRPAPPPLTVRQTEKTAMQKPAARDAISVPEPLLSAPRIEGASSTGPDHSMPASAPAAKPDEATSEKAGSTLPGPQPDAKTVRKKRPGTEHTLPSDVYRRLPKRKVSALAYSETPERRFVIVNSRKMVEKESTEQGLVVEEIVENGVIFSFQGHQFFKRMIP